MPRLSHAAGALVAVAMLAGLAGCSHSCVPHGWYRARPAPPLTRPPGAPKMAHDATYDIPGGPPASQPTRDEACLVQPPNTLKGKPAKAAKPAAPASVPAPATGGP